MDWTEEFPLRDDIIYLNHAAVSPWPRRTAEAVERFASENLRQGSLRYPEWLTVEQRLRQRAARLIGAPSADDVALVKNTSEALSFVAAGLPWATGENIVSSDQEFPSNRIVWESLAPRGVELRQVDLHSADTPEAALISRIDENTRLVAISSVQYASGLRLDLEVLGRACRERGVLFCVDAIQSIGATRFDVQRCHADFAMADGHKWMLGPEGLGLFYCRAELRERLTLTEFGWHMVAHMGDFDAREWQPAASARRFECGSPNMLGAHALDASLSLLEEVGMDAVEAAIAERAAYLWQALAGLGLDMTTPAEPGRRAGIVTFRIPDKARCDRLFAGLKERGVFCAQRGGGIRFSPHFYTPEPLLERVVRDLARLL